MQDSGVAQREFSVLHEMVEAVSVDAGLSGAAPSKHGGMAQGGGRGWAGGFDSIADPPRFPEIATVVVLLIVFTFRFSMHLFRLMGHRQIRDHTTQSTSGLWFPALGRFLNLQLEGNPFHINGSLGTHLAPLWVINGVYT